MQRNSSLKGAPTAPDVAGSFRTAHASPEHALSDAVLAAQLPGVRAQVAEVQSYYTPAADRKRPVAAPADLVSEIRAARGIQR